jgi:GAF domain-containing protein
VKITFWALSAYALDPDHFFRDDDINLLRSLADLGAQAVRNAILSLQPHPSPLVAGP